MGVIVLGIAVALGGWWYTSNQQAMQDKAMMEEKVTAEKGAMEKKEEAMQQPEAMMEKKPETMVKEDAMMKQSDVMIKGGQYASYDASKIAFAKDGKTTYTPRHHTINQKCSFSVRA